ncbi:hypothetical protein MG293_002040 [Ovis ammon polii]|uniref:Uncharacterized protein n=1 Tax=Ovis ammon polii TaxID=230172 RepID=A0AAD4US89_OVIAM|nr:hypothetical protein MG293_002040 [Ovis ammon polii]
MPKSLLSTPYKVLEERREGDRWLREGVPADSTVFQGRFLKKAAGDDAHKAQQLPKDRPLPEASAAPLSLNRLATQDWQAASCGSERGPGASKR